MAAIVVEYKPAPQSTQPLSEDKPEPVKYEPAAQLWQAVAPAAEEYKPGAHRVQIPTPMAAEAVE